MSLKTFRDGGAFVRTAFAANGSATAGGGGDNTAVNGPYQSRNQGYGPFMSAKLVITFSAVLGQGNTLSFTGKLQHADAIGGGGVGDVLADAIDNFAFPATVVATGPVGGGTVQGTVELDLNLAKVKDVIRAVITPDLSAANTDTCVWAAAFVFFGAMRDPVTKTLA